MAGAKIRGITIEISGDTTKLQKDLKTVNSVISDTQKELKDVEKLLKMNPGNVTLLKQKYKLLGDQIAYTEKKLETLKQAQKTMDENGVDKTSEQYMALQREIIDTESKLKSLNKELKDFGSVGAQVAAAVGRKMQDVGKKITAIGSKLTRSITVPLVAAGTASAKLASDYEENLNKIEVAFGDSADKVREWADNAIETFGLSKVAATDAVSSFGALGKGIGLAEEDAAEMSITLAGLSADLASYFNTSNDDAAKALEGIFTGEAESLKKFGVVMNETNLKAFAEDMGLVYDEMDQAQKTTLRYMFVLNKTSDAQGDYARTSDGTANSVKTFKAALEDVGTAIGTVLLPKITPIINKVTALIRKFDQLDPKTKTLITNIGLVSAAVGPILIVLGSIATGIGSLLELIPTLVSAFNPWILVIVAAIAAGVALYRNWDTIKEKAAELKDKLVEIWENVKTTTSEVWENVKTTISDTIENAKTSVTTTVDAVKTTLSNAWSAIRSRAASGWTMIKNAITKPFNDAKAKVQSIIDTIKGWFPIDIGNIFKNIRLPKFKITEGEKILGVTIPKISVEWNAKAMNKAVLLNGASIFGAMGGRLLGGGEAGREVVVSYDKLAQMMGNGGQTVVNMTVNAAPGMDERAFADYVARRIQQKVNQKGAVWA